MLKHLWLVQWAVLAEQYQQPAQACKQSETHVFLPNEAYVYTAAADLKQSCTVLSCCHNHSNSIHRSKQNVLQQPRGPTATSVTVKIVQ